MKMLKPTNFDRVDRNTNWDVLLLSPQAAMDKEFLLEDQSGFYTSDQPESIK